MSMSHNVLGQSVRPLYLTDPMNAVNTDEPQDTPESGEPTSTEPTPNESDWKKRYSDLKSYHDKQIAVKDSAINELKSQTSELTDKLVSESTNVKMPKTPEEFKEFTEKYPDLAAMITTAAMMVNKDTASVIDKRLKELADKQNELRTISGINELKRYHPDFDDINNSPAFVAWFNEQPLKVQEIFRSNDVKTVAKGLDIYKQETGLSKVQRGEARKNATREVAVPQRVHIGEGQKRTYSDSEVNAMSLKEFEKLQDDIRLAQADGRYLYGK